MSSGQSRKRKGDEAEIATRKSSNKSSKTGKTIVYDRPFAQNLEDHGIFMNNRFQKPSNMNAINQKLARKRQSLSPSCFSEATFEAFQQKNDDAYAEDDVKATVLPVIIGDAQITGSRNVEFNNLAPLTDGTISKDKPDYYEGSRPTDL